MSTTICGGCLSVDRTLSAIVELEQKKYFSQLLETFVSIYCLIILNLLTFIIAFQIDIHWIFPNLSAVS